MKKCVILSIAAAVSLLLGACNSANCPASPASCSVQACGCPPPCPCPKGACVCPKTGACPVQACPARACPTAACPCPASACTCPKGACPCPKKVSTPKKLTKDMFYKNGKFDEAAAKQAYFDMMTDLGYPISENLRKNMWVSDFGLGDFPAVGMGGIFWAHENKHGVFGHEIFLLPNQMLIEHAHVPYGGIQAKNECWQARAGVSYCFGEEGEMNDTDLKDVKVPESQKKFVTVHKVTPTCAKKGNVVWLNRIGAKHYQIAGPRGAVVTEYGSFHQNEGNVYTNPAVKF